MQSRPSNVEPLERRLKNSAAVSPLRGRSIAIMQIRHKRIDAGEACPLPRFQFLDRRARRGLAGQLGRRRHFGLELRLARLILGAALWTPILHAISHKIANRAMACHFARRSRSEENTRLNSSH